jgi:hypothetical protein
MLWRAAFESGRRGYSRPVKEERRKLFPIQLVDLGVIEDWECFDEGLRKDLGVEIRKYLIPDFSNWMDHDAFEAAFARLIENLKEPISMSEGLGREGPSKGT